MFVLSFMLFAGSALAGGSLVGNGGDRDEILWHSVMSTLLAYLETPEGQGGFVEVSTAQMAKLLPEVKIKVVEEELHDADGHIRTAINQPEYKRVLVNRVLFTPIREDAKVAVPLIFHEILGLMGVEKSGEYQVSNRIAGVAEVIYKGAVGNLGDIYFLTGDALKTPIPIYRTSVRLDKDGRFLEGVIARPFVLTTDKFQSVVNKDQPVRLGVNPAQIPDDGSLALQIANPHPDLSLYRSSDSEPWQKVPIPFFSLNPDNLSLQALMLEASLPGLAFHHDDIDGIFASMVFNSEGHFVAGSCAPSPAPNPGPDSSCTVNLGPKKAAFTQIIRAANQTWLSLSHDQSFQVFRRGNPLTFYGFVRLNSRFEVFEGRLTNSTVMINTHAWPIESIEVDSSGLTPVERTYDALTVDYAGTAILASPRAAELLCQDKDISGSLFHAKQIYFTGEQTFYDREKSQFVTLHEAPALVFDRLSCVDVARVDINLVEQKPR